jgi:hypothetical protein
MLHAQEHEELIAEVLTRIAHDSNTSLGRVKKLFLVKRNNAIVNQFWDTLDKMIPDHPFDEVRKCRECGHFELASTAFPEL